MRRFVPIVLIALSLVFFSPRSSAAQASIPSSSGGSGCVQTRNEVAMPTAPSTLGRSSGWSLFSRRTLAVLRSAPMLALWRRGLL